MLYYTRNQFQLFASFHTGRYVTHGRLSANVWPVCGLFCGRCGQRVVYTDRNRLLKTRNNTAFNKVLNFLSCNVNGTFTATHTATLIRQIAGPVLRWRLYRRRYA